MLAADIDTEAHYTHPNFAGIALVVLGPVIENTYEGDLLLCDVEGCDHDLSEMCWTEGEWSTSESNDRVRAVMVGDDEVHEVEVDDLTKLAEDAHCCGCGQIGCGW